MGEPEYVTLPCPECRNRSVVGVAGCAVEVGTGVAGIVYGHPKVLFLFDADEVLCNSTGCGWKGTAGEVREAARERPSP